MRTRDLGIQGSPGKGDADRTTDVKKFQDNLASIPLNPSDKTGFKKLSDGRYRKTYGSKKAEAASRTEPSAPVPTPASLMLASRAKRTALGGSSDH